MNALSNRILVLGLMVLAPSTVWSATISLNYSRGGGSPSSFSPSTGDLNINVGIPGVAKVESVEFFADFSFATTGSFSTNHRSNVTFSGPASPLEAPGLAKITIFQSGISNSFSENTAGINLSAGANVNYSTLFGGGTIPVTPLDVDLSLNTSRSGSGALGSTLTDTDSATAARIPLGAALGPVDIATVGASAQVSGSTTVKYGSEIDAILQFQHQENPSLSGSQAVSIGGLSEFLVDLAEPGFYDFTLSGFSLDGTLTSSKTPGVNLDLTVLNKVRAEKFLGIPGTSQSSTKTFDLTASRSLGFTLQVLKPSTIPEPNSVVLLATMAFVGMGVRRQRT